MNGNSRRSRNWVFTLNNPTPEAEDVLMSMSCRYMCFGREVAPTTGTPHLQGMVCFSNAKTMSAVCKLTGKCHLEIMRGTPTESRIYCIKDGDYFERGYNTFIYNHLRDLPADSAKQSSDQSERYTTAVELARGGELENIEPELYLKYYGTLSRIARQSSAKPVPLAELDNYWIWGPAGVGKSHAVYQHFPGAYLKQANKWWDGYDGEETIWIDDVDPDQTSWITRFLKIWGDKWAFPAEIKGSSVVLRPKRIIITSNWSIDAMGFKSNDIAAIKRRYAEILMKNREQILFQ